MFKKIIPAIFFLATAPQAHVAPLTQKEIQMFVHDVSTAAMNSETLEARLGNFNVSLSEEGEVTISETVQVKSSTISHFDKRKLLIAIGAVIVASLAVGTAAAAIYYRSKWNKSGAELKQLQESLTGDSIVNALDTEALNQKKETIKLLKNELKNLPLNKNNEISFQIQSQIHAEQECMAHMAQLIARNAEAQVVKMNREKDDLLSSNSKKSPELERDLKKFNIQIAQMQLKGQNSLYCWYSTVLEDYTEKCEMQTLCLNASHEIKNKIDNLKQELNKLQTT